MKSLRPTSANLHFLLMALMLSGTFAVGPLAAQSTRIWISPSNTTPGFAESPTVSSVNGSTRYLHVWAQPPAQKTLQNWSLNVVADQPLVDFLDDGIVVYNPALTASADRFQYVYDSSSTPRIYSDKPAGTTDRVRGLQGFTISAPKGLGIGNSCHANDRYCAPTTGGSAWLLASVPYRTTQNSGSANVFLQLGINGLNYQNENSSTASVIFGNGSTPTYNAANNRGVTLGGDTADFVAQSVATATDKHWTGGGGQWSSANWSGGGTPSYTNNAILDQSLGTNTVTVTGSQFANSVVVHGGRLDLSNQSSISGDITVKDGGAISGSGWAGGNLKLEGTLAITSTAPLSVLGKADVTGGELTVGPGYSQPVNSLSPPITILDTLGGIQGTLSSVIGTSLGGGLALHSIQQTTHQVIVRIRNLPGDFNHDGFVNAGDYTVWRDSIGRSGPGLAADVSGNNQVDTSDYNIWKANFGASAAGGGSMSVAAVVPEPLTIQLCLTLGVATFLFNRIGSRRLPESSARRIIARVFTQSRLQLLAGLIAWASLTATASATIWWTGNAGNGGWGVSGNWGIGNNNPTPPNPLNITNNDLVFNIDGKNGSGDHHVTYLNGTRAPSSITFRSAGSTQILAAAPGFSGTVGPLRLGAGGIGTGDGTGGTLTIGADIELRADQSWNNDRTLVTSSTSAIDLLGRTLTVTGGGNTTFVGNIRTSNGNLIKGGAGTLTIDGRARQNGSITINNGTLHLNATNNDYTLGTFINGGTLVAASDGSLGGPTSGLVIGDGTLKIGNGFVLGRATTLTSINSTIQVAGAGSSASIPAGIGGAGRLVKDGLGTLTLTNNNGFTGGTWIKAGTLVGWTGSLPGNILNDSSLIFDQATNGTYSAVISGPGAFTKINPGELIFTNANPYLGDTRINGGTLLLGNADAISNSTVNMDAADSGGLTFASNTIRLGGLKGSRNILLQELPGYGAEPVALSLGFNNQSTNYSGDLSGPGSLTKVGVGKLTLIGVNTYSGDTRIQGGTLELANPNAIANSTLHMFGPDGGSLSFGSLTSASLGSLAGTRGINLQNSFAQPVALSIGSSNVSGNDYGGQLGGTGSLTKVGSGVQYLSGANMFAGETRIASGSLGLRHSLALQNSTLSLDPPDSGGFGFGTLTSATFGGLRDSGGARVITLQNDLGGAVELRVGNNHSSNLYAGRFTGSGSLVKIGTGTLTLTGNNSHGGGTAVNGGALNFNGDANFGNGGISMDGGTLIANAPNITLTKSIALQSGGGTFNTNSHALTLTGPITGPGALRKAGAGTLVLTNLKNYGGGTFVEGGTLSIDPVGSSITGPVTVNPGATLTGRGSVSGNVDISSGGFLRGTLSIQGNVNNAGTVAPGFSPEIININGNYTQTPNGTLEIEVGGLTPGTGHDQLVVSGAASLNGTLRVKVFDNFAPQVGDYVTFLTAGQINGQFTDTDSDTFPGGLTAIPIFSKIGNTTVPYVRLGFSRSSPACQTNGACAQALTIGKMHVVPSQPNIVVGEEDIPAFALALRNPDAYFDQYKVDGVLAGDMDGLATNSFQPNGRLDFDDIDDFAWLVSQSSGKSSASIYAAINAALIPVPEPSSLLLLLTGLLLLSTRLRRGFAPLPQSGW